MGRTILAGNQNKERVSSIWRRSTSLRLLPTSSGLVDEDFRQRKSNVACEITRMTL